MHICFLCNEYPPGLHGGMGSKFQVIGRGLVERGHDVTVVGVYKRPTDAIENDRGVRVIRLAHTDVPRAGFFINGWRVRRTLMELQRRHPIDVVDGTELSLAALPRSFPAAKVIRMSGGHHFFAVTLGRRPRPWRSWIERRSFARADHLCGVSHFVVETTRQLLNLGRRPIEVLPNPVDTTLFRPRPDIPEESGLIVFVGTVCEKKGVRQLIEAMPLIVRSVPDARLWLVGRDYKDEHGASYLARYRALVPPALQDRILFKGPTQHDALPEILARAHIAVYPSHMEAQGIVNLEAMAMGKAVVSSHTGPGPELVEDGVSGLLCNPHDPASIANRIITLMRDADLRRKVGEQARRRVLDLFSEQVLIERNEAFHRQCVARSHAA
jgi:glycosyltransferase involved in cell wall biosynthesis